MKKIICGFLGMICCLLVSCGQPDYKALAEKAENNASSLTQSDYSEMIDYIDKVLSSDAQEREKIVNNMDDPYQTFMMTCMVASQGYGEFPKMNHKNQKKLKKVKQKVSSMISSSIEGYNDPSEAVEVVQRTHPRIIRDILEDAGQSKYKGKPIYYYAGDFSDDNGREYPVRIGFIIDKGKYSAVYENIDYYTKLEMRVTHIDEDSMTLENDNNHFIIELNRDIMGWLTGTARQKSTELYVHIFPEEFKE